MTVRERNCRLAILLLLPAALSCGREPHAAPPAVAPLLETRAANRRALPDSAFQVGWQVLRWPRSFPRGTTVPILLRVTNRSRTRWPAADARTSSRNFVVRLSYRWLNFGAESPPIAIWGERADLPFPLSPGESATVSLPVRVPADPESYRLQLSLVQESVAWFGAKGAETMIFPVAVQ